MWISFWFGFWTGVWAASIKKARRKKKIPPIVEKNKHRLINPEEWGFGEDEKT